MTAGPFVAELDGVSHHYRRATALDDVTVRIPARRLIGLIGPDGVGKSTLLAIVAGARRIQAGGVAVLGGDMRERRHRESVCHRIAYMPQGLGKNLYPDLSVRENIDFFTRLFGETGIEGERRIARLLRGTGLAPFAERPAGKLSGGMRQKLGLCCALVHDPDLLILDEPTTGVDPLSRRQFWELIGEMRRARPEISVLVATAYMEEADTFDGIIAMDGGRILATGTTGELKAKCGAETLEDAFAAMLSGGATATDTRRRFQVPPRTSRTALAIVAQSLTRTFGDFVAVDDVSFSIEQGEIFGFLGSNGCGKTTTMKMLTGLLPVTSGEAAIFGRSVDATDLVLRGRVGYMSQSFSLYSELTVRQNLRLHARLFHLPPAAARERVRLLLARFGLEPFADADAADLPLGVRQRLSLAVALVHSPELLILDEPTSGVDPAARDEFWRVLVELARKNGVTIFISTHFMNEAMRCDRIALMHAGRVLATGTPGELIAARNASTLDEAFISYLEEADPPDVATAGAFATTATMPAAAPPRRRFQVSRLLAYSRRETLELLRDPVRLAFALLGTAFLMIVFGFGINTDVEHLPFAALDRDQTPESHAYIQQLSGSQYFTEHAPLRDYADAAKRLENGELKLAIEIPPGFGRNLRRGTPTVIGAWIDGAMPFRAETARGYMQGVHQRFLAELARSTSGRSAEAAAPARIETRFKYNQDFKSVYAMVPSTLALLLALIPAILMALAVVREKELGAIMNLYVTPVTRVEFILGKQLPYIGLAFLNFLVLVAMAILIFDVPLKGSFAALAVGALAYVTATTAYGLVISSFATSQIAALFGTAILTVLPATQFSGMLTPVSSLSGAPAVMGRGFPMSYFLPVSVGAFTKSLGFADLASDLLGLAIFIPVLIALSVLLLRKQER